MAVAYLRVSSQRQALEHRHGFERQEVACRAWANEHRRQVSAVYRDAHTGTEADRPEWERMILDIGRSIGQGQLSIYEKEPRSFRPTVLSKVVT